MGLSLGIADLHLGQTSIIEYRPEFATVEEHDECMMDGLSIARKQDTIYFIGDIARTEEKLLALKKLPARKIILPGNHCTQWHSMSLLCEVFDDVHASIYKKMYGMKVLMQHIPADPFALRGGICIHGHLHTDIIKDNRYRCVSVDQTNYKPVKIESLIRDIQKTL